MKSLEERVAALEKSNRYWRYGTALIGVAALAIILAITAAAPSRVYSNVRTKCLEIVDRSETVVARIINRDGGYLQLFGPEGQYTGGLRSVDGGGANLELQSNSGKMTLTDTRLTLYSDPRGLDEHKRVEIWTYEEQGSPARSGAVLVTKHDASSTSILGGRTDLEDKHGKTVASISPGKEGGSLYLANNDGKTVAAINAGKDGGYFYLDDNDGKTIATISAAKEGGYFFLNNNDEKAVAGISAETEGGSFFRSNKDEKTAVSIFAGEDGGFFSLANNDGKMVARINAAAEGGFFLLKNNDEKTAATISAGKEDGFLGLHETNEGFALSASASNAGGLISLGSSTRGTSIQVGDIGIPLGKRQGRERLSLFDAGINDGGGGFVSVRNPAGATVAQMQCNKANAGLIMANDVNGNPKKTLSGD